MNKAGKLRLNDGFKAFFNSETSKIAAFNGLKILTDVSKRQSPRIKWLSPAQLPKPLSSWPHQIIFLGHDLHQNPFFAIDVSLKDSSSSSSSSSSSPSPSPSPSPPSSTGSDNSARTQEKSMLSLSEFERFMDVRNLMGSIKNDVELAAVTAARSLLNFHSTNIFCPSCRGKTESSEGGSKRCCSSCGGQYYPRIDPVVIGLVTDGDQCLLGRQPAFPPNYYSLLAGFIEPGETIEEAFAREVEEESGIKIDVPSVEILGSQFWPFPSNLMIGCKGSPLTKDITIDTQELEDAKWFSRSQIEEALKYSYVDFRIQASQNLSEDIPLKLPPPLAIAHRLIRDWVASS